MCIDYRKVNAVSVKDVSPLAHLNELLDKAGMEGNQFFSSMDLMMGYHQVKMTKEAERISTFVCHLGAFSYIRLPFGLCNAPSTFSNLMRKVLATLQRNTVFAYLDDVLVATPSMKTHLKQLEQVLVRFVQVGLTIKPEKSHLCSTQLKFLGFIVSADGIKADLDKIKVIQNFPQPDSITKLKGFLAMGSYYRRFVKDFSLIVKPLTDATQGSPVKLTWTREGKLAFQKLKDV
ncbi:MAG: RNA-directed DNA polymerase, partial [Desulfobacterales bacterium]|nr:RNA-directed DNA polymerase [Desulfobacterales bacterium]